MTKGKGERVGRVGGGVGTGKGTGKSMCKRLSKLPFSSLPFSFSPIISGLSAVLPLITIAMESQIHVSKRAPRKSEIGGCKEIRQPFANPSPTPRQPFANPLPALRQTFANLFCQPLSNPLFLWAPGTRLETRVNGFLE